MNDRPIPVTEDELHAYVDGELPAERSGDVEAWLAAHPEDAERVQSWRTMAEALHARYDQVANEPVPQRLELERLERQPRRWVYGSIAAALIAFVAGGGIGWFARGEAMTKRCGWDVRAPELASSGLKLVGGRLLPGPNGPASFLMYESASGERFTIYTTKAATEATQMRTTTLDKDSAMFWADRGVGYVVSGGNDRERLAQVARAVYEQVEKNGG